MSDLQLAFADFDVVSWVLRPANWSGDHKADVARIFMRLRYRLGPNDEGVISMSDGRKLSDLPIVLNVAEGEPRLGNGKLVEGGCGMLSALGSPGGWVALPADSMARLWSVFSAWPTTNYVLRITLGLSPMRSDGWGRWNWNVSADRSLTITTFEPTAATPSWYDED